MDSWKNIEKPLGCAEILKTLKHIKEKYSTNFFNTILHIPINETLKSPYILWLFTPRSSTREAPTRGAPHFCGYRHTG